MAYDKTILCLANSRKYSGSCVAGKEWAEGSCGGWIRPISARPKQEISWRERCYEAGGMARVLDIVRIRMKEPKPHEYQSENHLIDDGSRWIKVGRADWNDIERAVDRRSGPLWLNGPASYHGRNDRVPVAEAAKLTSSLVLISPTDLRLQVGVEGGVFGPAKRRVRALFTHGGSRYALAVTDPVVEQRYRAKGDGTFPIDDGVLCISLGEPVGGFAYKLVAAVITPDMGMRT